TWGRAAASAGVERRPGLTDRTSRAVAFSATSTVTMRVPSGRTNAFAAPPKPGGRILCYFDGDDAVAVWTHERLGQPTHRDILGIAREGGTDHARLYSWWSRAHHLVGEAE